MTKESTIDQIFLEDESLEQGFFSKMKFLFTELDIYKGALAISGSALLFFTNLSYKYIKKRNNKIDDLTKRMCKVEDALIVRTKGKKIPLGDYVQNLSHKIVNQEHAENIAFEEILLRLRNINTALDVKDENN